MTNLYFRVNLEQLKQTLRGPGTTAQTAVKNITNSSIDNSDVYSDAFEAQREWWWDIFTSEYTTVYYSIIFVMIIVFTTTRSLTFYRWCITAATKMHHTMFNNIVNGPMKFFNDNPSGRILNRFSRDIGTIDEMLPMTILDTVQVKISSRL